MQTFRVKMYAAARACFSVHSGIQNGTLSFHPIPCGTALSGHVTSGTILHGRRSSPRVSQLRQVTGSLSLLPTNQPHRGTTLGSCRRDGTS